MPESEVIKVVSNLIRKKFREIGLRAGKLAELKSEEFKTDRMLRYKSIAAEPVPVFSVQSMPMMPSPYTVVTGFKDVDRSFFVSVNISYNFEGKEMVWARSVMIIGLVGQDVHFQFIKKMPSADGKAPFNDEGWCCRTISLSDDDSLQRIDRLIEEAFCQWFHGDDCKHKKGA